MKATSKNYATRPHYVGTPALEVEGYLTGKEKFMKYFLILLLSVASLTSLSGHPQPENAAKNQNVKVYVPLSRVEFTGDGFIAYDELGAVAAIGRLLSYDDSGTYLTEIIELRGPCNLHNLWCKYCNGCGVLYCPMKCQCSYGGGG